jgi:hypothetical protein
MECEFCKTTFKTKYNMKYHQQKVKRCLIAQGKIPETEEYECDICNEKMDSKTSYNFHVNLCEKNDLIKRNKQQQETIEKLKKEIIKLKKEKAINKKIVINPIIEEDEKSLDIKIEKVETFVNKAGILFADDIDDNGFDK